MLSGFSNGELKSLAIAGLVRLRLMLKMPTALREKNIFLLHKLYQHYCYSECG